MSSALAERDPDTTPPARAISRSVSKRAGADRQRRGRLSMPGSWQRRSCCAKKAPAPAYLELKRNVLFAFISLVGCYIGSINMK